MVFETWLFINLSPNKRFPEERGFGGYQIELCVMLENELKMKCKTDPKLILPVLFKRFIDDGFGITKAV